MSHAVLDHPHAQGNAAPRRRVSGEASGPETASGPEVTGVPELVAAARVARRAYDAFDQRAVDAIVRAIGKDVYDRAEMLARLAIDETGIGVYADKVAKNRNKARLIWNNLKDKPSRGIIGDDPDTGLILVAKPVGVVGSVAPVTNPIVTPMCNAMFALKTGNAVIFAPHPRAEQCAVHLTSRFRDILREHGAPADLVQVVRGGSLEATKELMRSVDVVVATGGEAMVRAAYSCGRPSFGVGAGNVPVIIDRGVDVARAVEDIVTGAGFDNGIICSHEQFVLVPSERYDECVAAFLDTGRVWHSDDPQVVDRFREALFPGGAMNRALVGKSASFVGAMAGVVVPTSARVILLPAAGAGGADVLAREKLCPVVAILPYTDFDDALEKANANLRLEGAGHSAALHSRHETHIRRAGTRLPVSRLVVNQSCALAAGGSLTNGLAPTTTLGCGSWGGNSISENLDYKHLMNLSRIGRPIPADAAPTDEEIWAEPASAQSAGAAHAPVAP